MNKSYYHFFLSALLIPLFYSMVGLIFIVAPELPTSDLKISNDIACIPLLFTQEIGVLFLVFSILIRQIYNKSHKIYLSLNSTFILVLIMVSCIEPYLYFKMPNHSAPELLIILFINLFFIGLLIYEKKAH
ncbi:MAG: hypothetical protein HN522_05255 [Flavobacteriales bacterium]|jgi:hypothetical protein|nr:hypothetical protein [Flavobacteriales bacterium]MBT5089863.1 hypothetical protein [Flavobacteriales bacterium]MBT5749735.1 hypothetical protein [Flavobacteriales bacterium]